MSYTSYSRGGAEGVRLSINPRTPANITALDVFLLAEINRMKGGSVVRNMHGGQLSLFNKVYGSDSLRNDLLRGRSPVAIVASWRGFEDGFRAKRQKYLLYP